MKDIHIPPAALEAGARALHMAWIDNNSDRDTRHEYREWKFLTNDERADLLNEARAAFVAMVEAWPGMSHAHNEEGEIKDWATWCSLPWHRAESSNGIILPLMETRDDE